MKFDAKARHCAGEDAQKVERRRIEERSQNPNLFCIKRRKDLAPREFQSCLGSLGCRAEGLAARRSAPVFVNKLNVGEQVKIQECTSKRARFTPTR